MLNYSSLPGKIVNYNNTINKHLIGAILLSLGILFIAVDVEPLNDIFELQKLNFSEWIIVILVSLLSVFGTNFIIHVFNNQSMSSKEI